MRFWSLALTPALAALSFFSLSPRAAAAPFHFGPFADPILSASFSVNFAAFNAHRFALGFELNRIQLLGAGGETLDLSSDFFGVTDVLFDPPAIDMADDATQVFTAPIAASFFAALQFGRVGYDILITDTVDGFFAVDYFAIDILTTTGSLRSVIGNSSGDFGLGIPPGGNLPAPLLSALPPGSTGTGFDEALNSIGLQAAVPEPSPLALTLGGLIAFALARKARYIPPALAILAMLSGATGALAQNNKRVVCVSNDNSMFVNSNEGFERIRAGADIAAKKIKSAEFVIGGEIAACLAKLADGDELVIVMHACGESGGSFNWHTGAVLREFDGFGKENGPPSPVPDGFKQRKNIKALIISCRGCKIPAAGDKRSVCKKLLDEMDANGGSTCFGFAGVAGGTVGWVTETKPGKNATDAQIGAADACLRRDSNQNAGNKTAWVNNPPVGRDGAATTQLTAAQAIVDACLGAGGNVLVKKLNYAEPKEPLNGMRVAARDCTANKPLPMQAQLQQGQAAPPLVAQPLACPCACECGDMNVNKFGAPNRIAVTCPAPNPLRTGVEMTLLANVWSGDVGLPDQPVEFRKLLGGVQFLSGSVSPDGSRTTALTNYLGIASIQFKITQPGLVIIQAGIPGKTLVGISYLTAQ